MKKLYSILSLDVLLLADGGALHAQTLNISPNPLNISAQANTSATAYLTFDEYGCAHHHLLGHISGLVVAYVVSGWSVTTPQTIHHHDRCPGRQRHFVCRLSLGLQFRFGFCSHRAGQCLSQQHRRQSVHSYVSIYGWQHQFSSRAESSTLTVPSGYHGRLPRPRPAVETGCRRASRGHRRVRLQAQINTSVAKPLRPALIRDPSPSRPRPAPRQPCR